MAKYGHVAIKAVKYITANHPSPEEAWKKASIDIFPDSESSREKGCTKNTFLGLCEEGLVKDIPLGVYTRSKKNKEYALKAVELLKEYPELAEDQMKLWKIIVGDEKAHNYQMGVAVALFEARLI